MYKIHVPVHGLVLYRYVADESITSTTTISIDYTRLQPKSDLTNLHTAQASCMFLRVRPKLTISLH